MLSAAPRFLVFDLDGTLIDSSLDLCNSVNAALAHDGKPSLPNALIASYIGAAPLNFSSLTTALTSWTTPTVTLAFSKPSRTFAHATRICPWRSSPTSL
jgi:phosphoglycolate phosphatase-like HAD superfamily hydrolase